MRALLYVVAALGLLLSGCSKPRDFAAEQRAAIERDLGGEAKVERVNPPIGPFHLVASTSLYFHAVARDGKDYYCESYASAWTVPLVAMGGDGVVYLRRYYHRKRGVWLRTLK